MARVFVSYAVVDTAFATELAAWLGDQGHSVFFAPDADVGLQVGEVWRERLFREVNAADAMVCVVSPAFSASPWCSAEVTLAESGDVLLLPVAVTGARSTLLAELQHIDGDGGDWRERLGRELGRIDRRSGGIRTDHRSPFPGLAPFEMAMHRWFFGRDVETRRLIARLRSLEDRASGGLVVIVGPSGCGKSSLARAGLAAELAADPKWEVVPPFTPGPDPMGALARALAAGFERPLDVVETLGGGGNDDDDGLLRLAQDVLPPGRRLLLVIDQGDELLTPVADPEERSRLLRLVKQATAGPVRVVVTLRSELQDRLLALPELSGVRVDVQPLRPLAGDMLRVVVEEPTRRAGLTIDPELVTQLVADTSGGEALPLLAFTLQQLTEGLEPGDAVPADRYREIGGVRGALSAHADAALADASRASGLATEQVLDGMLQLVAFDPSGRRVRRRVDLDRQPPELRAALDVLVERRLLTTGSGDVAVVHEALFDAWAPLAAVIEARADALNAARSVERVASEWRAGNRSAPFFWGGNRLAVELSTLGYRPTVQGPLEPVDAERGPEAPVEGDGLEFLLANRAHVHAGQRRALRGRRRVVAVLATLAAVFMVASAVAVIQWRSSEAQRRLFTGRNLQSQSEARRIDQPELGMQLSVAALDVAPNDETRASLVSSLIDNHYVSTVARNGPNITDDPVPMAVASIAFSPDRRTMAADTLLAASDPVARDPTYGVQLWDVTDRRHPRALSTIEHTSGIWALAYSPDGNTLALGGPSGPLALWDVTDPADPQPLSPIVVEPSDLWIVSVAFSPDGDRLLLGTWDNFGDRRDHTALWDVADPTSPRPLTTLAGGSGAVHAVAFGHDGTIAATANDDGIVTLWDLSDPAEPRIRKLLTEHGNSVWTVAFSPDGERLATAGADRNVILWDVSEPDRPEQLATLTGHDGTVSRVAFSPDGTTLASGSYDGTAILWRVQPGESPTRLDTVAGHTQPLLSLAYGTDGHTIATGSTDGTVVLWETGRTAAPRALGRLGGGALEPVVTSPRGQLVATRSVGGRVLLWDLGDPTSEPIDDAPQPDEPEAVLDDDSDGGPAFPAGFSTDGHTLVTGEPGDGTVTTWDVSDPAAPAITARFVADPSGVWSASAGPDGKVVATGHGDGSATLWDLSDPDAPEVLSALPPLEGPVRVLSVGHDGRAMVEGSGGGTVVFWDISEPADPREQLVHRGPSSFYNGTFSPDGQVWASAEEGRKSTLWDLADPEHPGQQAVLSGNASSVYAVGFHQSGRILATGGYDKTVILWDLNDTGQPRQLLALPANGRAIGSVAFLPDRDILAVATGDEVVLWDVSRLAEIVDDPESAACDILGEGLGEDDWETYAPDVGWRETCPR